MGTGACSPWPGAPWGSRAPPALSLEMEHLHSSTHAKIRRQTGVSWQPALWVFCLSHSAITQNQENVSGGACGMYGESSVLPAGTPLLGTVMGGPGASLPPCFPCPPSCGQMDSIDEKHPCCQKSPFLSKKVGASTSCLQERLGHGQWRWAGAVPEPGCRHWVRIGALRSHALLLAPKLMFNLFVYRYLRLFDVMGRFVWLSTVGEQPVGRVRLICCGGM